MLESIEFKGKHYPAWTASHNAARFCMPFAQEVCKGRGFDIGYGREQWKFKDVNRVEAIGIDLEDGYDAMNLPEKITREYSAIQEDLFELDYIFSSHCLEHLPNWVRALEHWTNRLKDGGILFLYLPHYNQEYWRPFNNKKHIHALQRDVIEDCLTSLNYNDIISSGPDLNFSFTIIAEK